MLTKTNFGLGLALLLFATACGGANPYQGMDAETLFRTADQAFRDRDFDDAVRALDRFLLAFGDSDLVPEARLMLAQSYFEQRDHITARAEFQRFLDRHAGHALASEAALGICESLSALSPVAPRDQGYTEEALTACRNMASDYQGTSQASRAAELSATMRLTLAEKEYLNGDFYLRRRLFDSAIKYFEFVLVRYSDTRFAADALFGMYKANQEIGYDDLAEEARERLMAEYPDSDAAARLLLDGSGS